MPLIDMLTLVPAQGAGEGSTLLNFLPIVLLFLVMYFLMIRPQMKRQKEHRNMVAALAKNDEVITSGGLLGKVTKVSDHYITLEIAELADKPVEITLQRAAVTTVLPKGTIKGL